MNENVVIFIIRKILMPFLILLCFYNVYKNKKVTLRVIFLYLFSLFSVFAHTVSFRHNTYYDIIDKFLILVIYPIGFLILSLLFFKTKNENVEKEKSKYIALLILFIITEVLFIFNIF